MNLTNKQVIAIKDIQKCCDAGIGGAGRPLESSDIHRLCNDWLEQHAEIEKLKAGEVKND